jgi:hypothetical protein
VRCPSKLVHIGKVGTLVARASNGDGAGTRKLTMADRDPEIGGRPSSFEGRAHASARAAASG